MKAKHIPKTLIFLLLVVFPLQLTAASWSIELQVKASRAIRSGLKDPKSFEWVEVYKKDSKQLGRVIYGTYRAKNSFGGYTIGRFIYSHGHTLLLSHSCPRFNEAWRAI
tara:strand:+ start:6728 stop:7054 length:327 start_codon:yes stop_codon:yes gene_type:complete